MILPQFSDRDILILEYLSLCKNHLSPRVRRVFKSNIVKQLRKKGLKATYVSVSSSLNRLHKLGLVTQKLYHSRVYFVITPKGEQALERIFALAEILKG